jgi:hypothetical protein
LHPPTQGDALTYHAPLGVYMWSYGDLTTMLNRGPEEWGLSWPGTAELFNGLLRLLGGERLADLGQLPLALIGAAAAYAFARRTGLRGAAAALAPFAFILIPIVALQVGTQANDVAGSAFLMSAIALASASPSVWQADRVAAIAAALGLAAATKSSLLPGVLVVGLFVLVASLRASQLRAAAIALAGVCFVAVVAPWWIRNASRYGNPIYPQTLPIFGHGVNIGARGAIDFEFVPRAAAWPLYPFLEPIDERSGYGALFAVFVLPGLFACWRRGRRWPLALLLASFIVTLPLWWKYSLHEPRFLLPYVGLAAALVPWSLYAVSARARPITAVALACAAVFSVFVSFDQAILPLARLPVGRSAFYDRLWAVDPTVVSLPERDGILQVTGFGLGRVDYASTYPLLGRHQRRVLVPLDASGVRLSQTVVVRRMRATRVRYAYVTAITTHRAQVQRLFAGSAFRLLNYSTVVQAELIGARRHLFRPGAPGQLAGTIARYLFELR